MQRPATLSDPLVNLATIPEPSSSSKGKKKFGFKGLKKSKKNAKRVSTPKTRLQAQQLSKQIALLTEDSSNSYREAITLFAMIQALSKSEGDLTSQRSEILK